MTPTQASLLLAPAPAPAPVLPPRGRTPWCGTSPRGPCFREGGRRPRPTGQGVACPRGQRRGPWCPWLQLVPPRSKGIATPMAPYSTTPGRTRRARGRLTLRRKIPRINEDKTRTTSITQSFCFLSSESPSLEWSQRRVLNRYKDGRGRGRRKRRREKQRGWGCVVGLLVRRFIISEPH